MQYSCIGLIAIASTTSAVTSGFAGKAPPPNVVALYAFLCQLAQLPQLGSWKFFWVFFSAAKLAWFVARRPWCCVVSLGLSEVAEYAV